MLSGQSRRVVGRVLGAPTTSLNLVLPSAHMATVAAPATSDIPKYKSLDMVMARLPKVTYNDTPGKYQMAYPYSRSDALLEDVYAVLSKQAPGFPITQQHIDIIPTPRDFYASIIRNISHAKHRIVLSALYIGTGEQEQGIFTALATALREKPSLSVHLMFDGSRGCRIEKTGKSSLDLCASLMREFGTRVTTAMVKPPVVEPHLRGPPPSTLPFASTPATDVSASTSTAHSPVSPLGSEFWSPLSSSLRVTHTLLDAVQRRFTGRLNELCAVHHSKLYLCDDTVILTGANASQVYFEQRQDRYVSVRDAALCDWLVAYSQVMALMPYATLYSGLPQINSAAATETTSSDAEIPVSALKAPNNFFPRHWLTDPQWSPAARDLNPGANTSTSTDARAASGAYADRFRAGLHELLLRQQSLMVARCGGTASILPSGVNAAERASKVEIAGKSSRATFVQSLVALRALFDSTALAHAAESSATSSRVTSPAQVAAPRLDAGSVLLFPLVEWRAIGITHDSTTFNRILDTFAYRIMQNPHAPQVPTTENANNSQSSHLSESIAGINIVMETGYFNPPQRLLKQFAALLACGRSNMNVVTGGLGSNGWSDAKGATAQIPVLYNTLIQHAIKFVNVLAFCIRHARTSNTIPRGLVPQRFRVWEYVRPDWSYHAKGLWVQYVHGKPGVSTSASDMPPELSECSVVPTHSALTIVGSSNYGVRSHFRDNELQFYVLVPGATQPLSSPSKASSASSDTVSPSDPLADTYRVLTDTTLPLTQRMDAELKLSFAFAQIAADPTQVKWYLKPFVSLIGRFM